MADGQGSATENERKRYARLKQSLQRERQTYEAEWKDLAEHFLPNRGQWFLDKRNARRRSRKLVDGTPRYAARTLASGLMAGLTSPARPWFRLVTPDAGMMEYGPVKEWLYIVEQRMRDVFTRSNLYNTLPVVYSELGVFGTMAMMVEEDRDEVIRTSQYTIGSYWIANNSRLQADTFVREFEMTVRQMEQEFGRDALSEQARSLIECGNREQPMKVTQVIIPARNEGVGSYDEPSMTYRGCYFETANGELENKFLMKGGFKERPFLVGRWEVTGDEAYGYGPASDALGDARQLQFDTRKKAQAVDKHVDPPMVGHPSLRNDQNALLPGVTTFVEMTAGNPGFTPAYVIKPEIQQLREDILDLRNNIRIAMFENLFLMLSQSDRREITAREIDERHEEKLLMLGPVLERLNDEVLDPLVDRTFKIMTRRSRGYWEGILVGNPLIPPPPPELENVDLRVEYISMMAQAQRMVATTGLEATAAFATAVGAINPEVIDKVDVDQLMDEYAQARGVPPTVIRSDDMTAEIRRKRQAAQAAQMAAQQVPEMAKTVKMLGETPAGGNTALTKVGEAIAGQAA